MHSFFFFAKYDAVLVFLFKVGFSFYCFIYLLILFYFLSLEMFQHFFLVFRRWELLLTSLNCLFLFAWGGDAFCSMAISIRKISFCIYKPFLFTNLSLQSQTLLDCVSMSRWIPLSLSQSIGILSY